MRDVYKRQCLYSVLPANCRLTSVTVNIKFSFFPPQPHKVIRKGQDVYKRQTMICEQLRMTYAVRTSCP